MVSQAVPDVRFTLEEEEQDEDEDPEFEVVVAHRTSPLGQVPVVVNMQGSSGWQSDEQVCRPDLMASANLVSWAHVSVTPVTARMGPSVWALPPQLKARVRRCSWIMGDFQLQRWPSIAETKEKGPESEDPSP